MHTDRRGCPSDDGNSYGFALRSTATIRFASPDAAEKGDYYDIADGVPQFDTVPPLPQ